jgi:tetratricopeptide (TPR) repeat protein
MKNLVLGTVLTVVFLVALESMADAQGITLEYKRQTSNSELVVTWSGGYWGSGYAYGYGTGYGYGCRYPVGSSYVYPGSYYRFPRYSYSTLYYGSRAVYNYSPVLPRSEGRKGILSVRKEVEEGLRYFRRGNYAGALASFKRAYLADTGSAPVRFLFGLALVGAGDSRNADKAFTGALEDLSPADVRGTDLSSMFGSVRQEEEFGKRAVPGSLSAGVVALLLGDEAGAKKILSAQKKNAAARKLLRSFKP